LSEIKLQIDGMSCAHCVHAVHSALKEVPGVEVKRLEVGTADVELDESRATLEQLQAAVAGAGYEARVVDQAW
jgi:copper chaperone